MIFYLIFIGSEASATLQDILVFTTGSGQVPPLGYGVTPSIEFIQERLPTANTCSVTIRLPTVHEDYDKFKESMDLGILNSPLFGIA